MEYSQMITELRVKYKDNNYILQRLETHLTNLPNILEQESKKYDERINRFNELTQEQDNFHKVFLSKHQYYYMPYNNIYYEYDGKSYKIVKDDDIHYELLSTITDEGKLTQWKHKTKQTIIKKIKERSLFKSTPETYTIQNVLKFLQTIFVSKTEAKYFLTVIGDCVLKKNTENLLYFVSSNLKKIVAIMDALIYHITGTSIMSHFITKYHDSHKLGLYRLIKTMDNISYDVVRNMLNNIGTDVLCVATHYSERYGNADLYLSSKEDEVKNYTFYFVNNPLEQIVDDFVSQCIEQVSTDSTITWKSMHYIWKLYLSSVSLPNMIYANQLQQLLANRLQCVTDNASYVFVNVTSKYLPAVGSFLAFWEKYVTITEDANEDEYEIDELVTLYKISDQKNVTITEASIIKLICHYFSPQVEVIDNKYVTNIKCSLWVKEDDINEFLKAYKDETNVSDKLIAFDDLYQCYKTFIKAKSAVEQKQYLIVSKQYFEKFIESQLAEYVQFDTFVSSEWIYNTK